MPEPVDSVVIHRENTELTIRITPNTVRVQVDAADDDPQPHEDEKVQRKRAVTRRKSPNAG